MKKDLSTLESEMHTYDKESQNFIKSLTFVDKEISSVMNACSWAVRYDIS